MNQVNNEITLNPLLLSNLIDGKIIKEDNQEILSVDFSKDGSLLLIASLNSLYIYDIKTVTKKKTLHNKTFKIKNAIFFHSNDAVIYNTNSDPYEIHFWSLYDNEIQKVFKGHNFPIQKLELNLHNDYVVSSNSKELFIWNLEANHYNPIFKIEENNSVFHYLGCFEPSGLVLAINKLITKDDKLFNVIELYNLKKLSDKYFINFIVENPNKMVDMKFSNDMKYMFLIDNINKITLLDAFDGFIIYVFNKESSLNTKNDFIFSSCFTPDSAFIISGCEDGSIKIYDIETKQEISKYEGHSKNVNKIVFNPCYVLFVSISKELIVWVPKYTELN